MVTAASVAIALSSGVILGEYVAQPLKRRGAPAREPAGRSAPGRPAAGPHRPRRAPGAPRHGVRRGLDGAASAGEPRQPRLRAAVVRRVPGRGRRRAPGRRSSIASRDHLVGVAEARPGGRRTRPRRRPTPGPWCRGRRRGRGRPRAAPRRPRRAAWSCRRRRRRPAPPRPRRGRSPASRARRPAPAAGTRHDLVDRRDVRRARARHVGAGGEAEPVAVLVAAEQDARRTPSAAGRPTWSSRRGRRHRGCGVTAPFYAVRATRRPCRQRPAEPRQTTWSWRQRPSCSSRATTSW